MDEIELTAEEQADLAAQENPDEYTEERYNWDEEFQRHIIGMLLKDRYFIVQSLGLIKPIYFTNEAHAKICEILFKHFEKYKTIPSQIYLKEELEQVIKKKSPETQMFFRGELNTVYKYYIPGLDSRDYLRDKISNFAKRQSIKAAFYKSLEVIEKDPEEDETWVKVHDMLREAMTVERNFDAGLEYFQSYEERYARVMQGIEAKEIFTSGYKQIDNALAGGGLCRGEMAGIIGLSGTGKSLFLVQAALANMTAGKKVLYITLEMDEDKVAERFDAQLAGPGSEDLDINTLYENSMVVFDALRDYVTDYEDSRLLVIKQFPAGQMDVSTFRAYHQQLALYGFNPDLIIIDYVGEMKDFPNMPTWESRYRITRDLRGFAVEENVCVFTAMQPGKSAKEVIREGGVIDDENLADAYGQIRPLDALWSINQMQLEKECGLARVFVAKHRHGKSRFTFHVEINPKTLAIKDVSLAYYERKRNEHEVDKKEVASQSTAKDLKKKAKSDQFDKVMGSPNLPTSDKTQVGLDSLSQNECGDEEDEER